MTTREKIERARKQLTTTVIVFMFLCFTGIFTDSTFLTLGGLVIAIGANWYFASQMKCPMCQSSLCLQSRQGTKLNFCPGCARPVDEEEIPG